MSIFIPGFRIEGYRSLSTDSDIGPFRKMNLFVGINNAGKSNVLRFIRHHYKPIFDCLARQSTYKLTDQDYTRGRKELLFTVCCDNIPKIGKPVSYYIDQPTDMHSHEGTLASLFQSVILNRGTKSCWVEYLVNPDKRIQLNDNFLEKVRVELGPKAHRLTDAIQRHYSLDRDRVDFKKALTALFSDLVQGLSTPPEAALLATHRQIIPHFNEEHLERIGAEQDDDLCGRGLARRLSRLMNPPANKSRLYTEKMRKLNAFLQDIAGLKHVRITVPDKTDEVNIELAPDEDPFPLESLGTGIHQMMIIAAAATSLDKRVVCIEEPETNLHPILQRKLLRYLNQKTDNQYFITTHSASIIDIEQASVFRVEYRDRQTYVSRVISPGTHRILCDDLGYRASDIVQANCVVWVEGPSDKIYIKHWLSRLAPDLIEGLQFVIMHYGGALRAYLTASDEDTNDELTKLRYMNRNLVFVADSDRESKNAALNHKLEKLIADVKKGGGIEWVTGGRTMESYLNAEWINDARPEGYSEVKQHQYKLMVPFKGGGMNKKYCNKPDLARRIVDADREIPNRYRLHETLEEVVRYIRKCNELEMFPSQ